MKDLSRFTTLACGLLITSTALHAQDASRYVVIGVTTTDLGTLGGAQSSANDINNAGSVVGWAEIGAGIRHAALFESGSVMDVGFSFGSARSEARGINNSRTIVGNVNAPIGQRAFRWIRGGVVLLNHGTHPTGRLGSEAWAVTDTGLIAGQIFLNGTSDWDATVWLSPDTYYHVARGDSLQSYAVDMNSERYVVGYDFSGYGIGVRWGPDGTRTEFPLPRGAPWTDSSRTHGINRSGAVVGSARISGAGNHAIHWDGVGEFSSDLGVLPTGRNSRAEDINNNGFIAGYADTTLRFGTLVRVLVDSAFIYHPDFGIRALPKHESTTLLGGCYANALNDHQNGNLIQVVGFCETTSGQRAVRWDVTVLRVLPT